MTRLRALAAVLPIVCLPAGGLAGCSNSSADSADPANSVDSPEATAPQLPAGEEKDGWWVADDGLFKPTMSGWALHLFNNSDTAKSTYVKLTFYNAQNRLLVQAQCMATSAPAEFTEPGDDVWIGCAPADGTPGAGPLPNFDHYELGVLDGFPASPAE